MHHPCWFNPFTPNISFSNSSLCLPYNSHDIGSDNLVLHQLLTLYWYFIDIFLYCHHLSVWYCIEWYIITIVWRNSFLVTHRSWRVQITQILNISMHGKVKNKGTYSKKIISIKSQKKLANFSKIWMDCYKCTGVSLVTLLKFKWSRAKCEKMK